MSLYSAEGKGLEEDPSSGSSRVTVVLLGKVGTGKSSTANMLLGREEFRAMHNSSSVTRCSERADSADGELVVIDTPGLKEDGDAGTQGSLAEDLLFQQIGNSVNLAGEGGVTALLLVLNLATRVTEEDCLTLESLGAIFGPDMFKRAIIVWTHAEELAGGTLESYLENASPRLTKLLTRAGNRNVLVENRHQGPGGGGGGGGGGGAAAGEGEVDAEQEQFRAEQVAVVVRAAREVAAEAGGPYTTEHWIRAREDYAIRKCLGFTLLGDLRMKQNKRVRQVRSQLTRDKNKEQERREAQGTLAVRGSGGAGAGRDTSTWRGYLLSWLDCTGISSYSGGDGVAAYQPVPQQAGGEAGGEAGGGAGGGAVEMA